MDELDRNIALCTCLEVEEIRGKSQKNMKIKFQFYSWEDYAWVNAAFWFIWLDNFICGKAKEMDIIYFCLFIYLFSGFGFLSFCHQLNYTYKSPNTEELGKQWIIKKIAIAMWSSSLGPIGLELSNGHFSYINGVDFIKYCSLKSLGLI